MSSATSQPHNVGQNFSFLDGHAEYVKPNDNSSAKYGLYVGGQDVHEVAGQFATLP